MISYDKLASGHGFSFSDQPYLAPLFRDVQDLNTPLTVVVGAGVSMNAGLHSWKQLLENMVKQIKDEHLRRMVSQDSADPMRKAELILQLIKKDMPEASDSHEVDAKIIREALYPRTATGEPGLLAKSIARLVVARRRNIRLITTNFDTVLEKALEFYFDKDQVKSFVLDNDNYSKWKKWCGKGRIGVLHVHGVVHHPRSRAKTPGKVVLTESQFFRNGSEVRDRIVENIKDANSIFVGLSMTDPNLVGPMYDKDIQDTTRPRYALTVPDQTAGAKDSRESMRYAIEAADFMERELKLSTIFLKSYSQLNQVLSDLGLAIEERDKYQLGKSGDASSLVYENRLAAALDGCYARIGCPDPGQPVPLDEEAAGLHNKLYAELRAVDGPIDVLQRLAAPYGEYRIGDANGENFALFLWLMCRQTGLQRASYALNLIATSAYVHREVWSIKWWEQPIIRESKMVAVNAVFLGTNVATNLSLPDDLKIWRGIMACPIVMDSTVSKKIIGDSPLDTVTVGAITLNSTHYVNKHDPRVPQNDRSRNHEHSAIMALNPKETDQVYKSITKAASGVLSAQTGRAD